MTDAQVGWGHLCHPKSLQCAYGQPLRVVWVTPPHFPCMPVGLEIGVSLAKMLGNTHTHTPFPSHISPNLGRLKQDQGEGA